jgi:hypothetical protein
MQKKPSKNPQVYCAHEYTASNARFAVSVNPSNAALAARKARVDEARAKARGGRRACGKGPARGAGPGGAASHRPQGRPRGLPPFYSLYCDCAPRPTRQRQGQLLMCRARSTPTEASPSRRPTKQPPPTNQPTAANQPTNRRHPTTQQPPQGEPTVPSLLGDELDTNPFLRPGDPEIRSSVGAAPGAPDWEVFGAVRRAKDGFRG